MIGTPEPACLLIADISGYTGYLAGVELDHAQDILADLVSTVVGAIRPTFRLSKLEGDAAFAYVIAPAVDGSLLQDTVDATYFAFQRRLRDIAAASRCECNACIRIPNLDLKVVVHHGTVIRQRIAGREELLGADVILVHRLLKSDVVAATGFLAYALYSEPCIAAMGISEPERQGFLRHVVPTDIAGDVTVWLRDLGGAWRAEQERTRRVVDANDAIAAYTFETPAPPQVTWEYITSPIRRPQWAADAIIEQTATGRRGPGTVNHCIHGRDAIVEEILDYRPYEHLTVQSKMPMPGLPKLVSSQVLEPLPGGGTRVSLRFANPKPRDRARVLELRPILDSMIAHSFEQIAPLLEAEALQRAPSADDPSPPESLARNLTSPVVP